MIACIATKNRQNTKTYKLFEEVGIPFLHFIEPQDYDSYTVPNKVSIEKNDKGLMYVRNFILEYAKKNNIDWFIMSDDDITQFGKSYGTKCITTDANIFKEIHSYASKYPFEVVAINYRQHAWHEKKAYSINNGFADVCVMINAAKVSWKFEDDLPLKGDREFCLKAMKYGNGVLKFNKYFYNTPGIGTNAGGLQTVYQQKRDIEDVKRIVYTWKPYATQITNSMGRADFKFDFKSFCNDFKKINK